MVVRDIPLIFEYPVSSEQLRFFKERRLKNRENKI